MGKNLKETQRAISAKELKLKQKMLASYMRDAESILSDSSDNSSKMEYPVLWRDRSDSTDKICGECVKKASDCENQNMSSSADELFNKNFAEETPTVNNKKAKVIKN